MKTTPQQDAVLIALTRDHLPRTVENLAVETGIPKASIRRVLSELRQTTYRSWGVKLCFLLHRVVPTSF